MNYACAAVTVTGLVMLSPIIAYAIARLVFAAYFITKRQFTRRT